MSKVALLILFNFLLLSNTKAQPYHMVYDGIPYDSTVFNFKINDSLSYSLKGVAIDTSMATLWRIGGTQKPFFTQGTTVTGAIMTDTSLPYPINANDWFTLKIARGYGNTIVSFTHLYRTDSMLDGGIVEYSIDGGSAWHNLEDSCNSDTSVSAGIITENFYKKTDTLFNGEMGFSGYSGGWIRSRFQFFQGIPVLTTGGGSGCLPQDTVLIRFRFISDSVADNQPGWIITNITIENDIYWGAVKDISRIQKLIISPNPSANGIFNFPSLDDEDKVRIEVINELGQVLISSSYSHTVNLSGYSTGLFFYRVFNENQCFSGTLYYQ